jgi:hypothetical protein
MSDHNFKAVRHNSVNTASAQALHTAQRHNHNCCPRRGLVDPMGRQVCKFSQKDTTAGCGGHCRQVLARETEHRYKVEDYMKKHEIDGGDEFIRRTRRDAERQSILRSQQKWGQPYSPIEFYRSNPKKYLKLSYKNKPNRGDKINFGRDHQRQYPYQQTHIRSHSNSRPHP